MYRELEYLLLSMTKLLDEIKSFGNNQSSYYSWIDEMTLLEYKDNIKRKIDKIIIHISRIQRMNNYSKILNQVLEKFKEKFDFFYTMDFGDLDDRIKYRHLKSQIMTEHSKYKVMSDRLKGIFTDIATTIEPDLYKLDSWIEGIRKLYQLEMQKKKRLESQQGIDFVTYDQF